MTSIAEIVPLHPPLASYGQGKKVQTLLAEQGHLVTVITDVPYKDRVRPSPLLASTLSRPCEKGARPMHRSTLMIPTQPYTDYKTTVKSHFSGYKARDAPEKRFPFGSQHISQIRTNANDASHWYTNYKQAFIDNNVQMPSVLHRPAWENGRRMGRSDGVLSAVSSGDCGATYWTQYKRCHDKLGVMRGPGVVRELPVRQRHHPLTGAKTALATKTDHRRISGNRILYHGFDGDHKSDLYRQSIIG